MATKNIAIREDVYKKLLSTKREGESFSDAVERLLEKKTSVLSFAGIFSKDDEEMKIIEREVKNMRKRGLTTFHESA